MKRILFLSSIVPDFGHFRAGQTVLASLMSSLVREGHRVGVAIANEKLTIEERQIISLEEHGIDLIESEFFNLRPISSAGWLERKRYFLGRIMRWDLKEQAYPRFQFPDKATNVLLSYKPDAMVLFWDTHFENLLPSLSRHSIPCHGYLARPPMASNYFSSNIVDEHSLKRRLLIAWLDGEQKSHLLRMKHLTSVSNICAVDTAWYSVHDVKTSYISNTWPDEFGANFQKQRERSEGRRSGLHMLGNIGGLNATGNMFGMQYLLDNIVPLLRPMLEDVEWTLNICGRFSPPNDLAAKLSQPNVVFRGFVDDIGEEILGNHLFLLMNNAGPYTGGYTRVMYAFSSGACLIAHARLANSMPELKHNTNCLLGNDPHELASLINEAARDASLRQRIGRSARATYESDYAPRIVAEKILRTALNV